MVEETLFATLREVVSAAWSTAGVSEFLAALLGGSMTLVAQRWALRHDREKEKARLNDQRKALAWAIYFKISAVFEALTHLGNDLREARLLADAKKAELWQVFQCPPHDPQVVGWTPEELVLMIDQKQFDLMERYRMAAAWLSNVVQSMRVYRAMRVDFLSSTSGQVSGTSGSIIIDDDNRDTLMPVIAHLRSLSSSLEKVVLGQEPEVRKLLVEYAASMERVIGHSPRLEFVAIEASESS